MKKEYVFLSGLPRTGSTLLSAILDQNPLIHAEGNSAVCQLMWDMQVSCETASKEQLAANSRLSTQDDLISAIPDIYYQNASKPIVVDKCRSWAIQANVDMIKRYITPSPKIIMLIRPLQEIFASFGRLKPELVEKYFISAEPINRSFFGVLNAKKNNSGEYLFISYDELVLNTEATLQKLYKYCGWESFEHALGEVVSNHPENDEVYGIPGQHEIRPKIAKREIEFKLPDRVLDQCMRMNEALGL
jgi:sulfotransferase